MRIFSCTTKTCLLLLVLVVAFLLPFLVLVEGTADSSSSSSSSSSSQHHTNRNRNRHIKSSSSTSGTDPSSSSASLHVASLDKQNEEIMENNKGNDDGDDRVNNNNNSNQKKISQQQQQQKPLSTTRGGKGGNSNETIRTYQLWTPKEIHEEVYRWVEHYPEFIQVTTAQELYSLPTAGTKEDCPYQDKNIGCFNYILTIQDYTNHPENYISSKLLPEVLWSGELHGDERVGPTAVLEAVDLLLMAASCESHPKLNENEELNPIAWTHELSYARSCRQELRKLGIQDHQRQWLARLVSTRRLIVIPTANALGYYRNRREENGIDPNRDFPYDQDPNQCMMTIAARVMNEIYRTHLIQLALTFHGGMRVIGYEWGAYPWKDSLSPDDTAQKEIAASYSQYAGGWEEAPPYQYGPMNPMVYPVRGGMEDWAYAGSWDPKHVQPCTPKTFGGYPKEKTIYNNSTLRAFMMLIETSDQKNPPVEELGTSEDVLIRNSNGNGHVARNIRLALLSLDMVQPYVVIQQVNELKLTDDIVPQLIIQGRSCQKTRAISVPAHSGRIIFQWVVGGAVNVDHTQIWYAKWDDIPESMLDCILQPDPHQIKDLMQIAIPMTAPNGTGIFSTKAPSPPLPFVASIDIGAYQPHDKLVVLGVAEVDKIWSMTPNNSMPAIHPQSHIVNARTNPDWYHEIEGSMIKGRKIWFSVPLTIEIGEFHNHAVGNKGEQEVETIELSTRFPSGEDMSSGGMTPSKQSNNNIINNSIKNNSNTATATGNNPERQVSLILVVIVILIALYCAGSAYLRYTMRISRRSQVREFIEDETAISPGLRYKKQQQKSMKSKATGGYSDATSYDEDDDEENGHVEMSAQ